MPRGQNKMIESGPYRPPVCEWDQEHPQTGKTWRDMPGDEQVNKKLDFFLYRRGLLQENTKGIKSRFA